MTTTQLFINNEMVYETTYFFPLNIRGIMSHMHKDMENGDISEYEYEMYLDQILCLGFEYTIKHVKDGE